MLEKVIELDKKYSHPHVSMTLHYLAVDSLPSTRIYLLNWFLDCIII